MRCKKHTTDATSINGVCASCLRDRLLKLVIAQEESQSIPENINSIPLFHTSASPYITRRKSDASISHNIIQKPYNHRFYNSPQIAISTPGCIARGTTTKNHNHNNKKLIKFATFQNLFRSNNNNSTNIPISMTSSSTPSSSATTRRINNHRQQERCVRNRGMSPVRLSDDDGEDDGSSEYESIDIDRDTSCKQTPMKTIGGRRGGGNKSVSEMFMCLSSPLVRANPNRLLKGKPPVDDVRIPVVPKLAYTKSFCANRSRKLADFGRSDPNR